MDLEEGVHYFYKGPTWLSDEIRYGDTLKYIRTDLPNFAVVTKLGAEDTPQYDVPSAHLVPLRSSRKVFSFDNLSPAKTAELVDILRDAKDYYEELDRTKPKIRYSKATEEYFRKMKLADPNDLCQPLSPQEQIMQAVIKEKNRVDKENSMLGKDEIQNRFGFHRATIEGQNATLPKHREIRQDFVNFANFLDWMLPDGRTKEICLKELEDASMWAHKSISESAPLVNEEGDGKARNEVYKDAVEEVEQACVLMHDAYEAAALTSGWETNKDSRKPWSEVPEANKNTMRAAVKALLVWVDNKPPYLKEEVPAGPDEFPFPDAGSTGPRPSTSE
jgi:hypothetical protein